MLNTHETKSKNIAYSRHAENAKIEQSSANLTDLHKREKFPFVTSLYSTPEHTSGLKLYIWNQFPRRKS
jgi:hypothetical protein